jgi:acetolactate synthase-1/2/3 large subunit
MRFAMIKLSDYIAKRLKEHGVERFFIVSGGGAMHLNDSLGRVLPYTAFHHEQSCSFAAEGYSRINQKLSVVNITTGPGGLNCLNGVFGQWTDSVPVLYISGQVKQSTTIHSCKDLSLRQLGDQEVDIISVVSPLTKYAKMVTEPNEIKYHIDKAIYEATTNRKGPVWLDIPMDIQGCMIDESQLKEFVPPEKEVYELKIAEVIEQLKKAKSPLLIAGNGIHLSKKENIFIDLLEKLNIPVVTTFNAVDIIPSSHKCFCGRIGTSGNRSANFTLQNADLLLCLGTRNNIRQISYNWENFAPNAYKIVVDIDENELNKPTFIPDLKIKADLADFLPELYKYSFSLNSESWLDFSKKLYAKYDFENLQEYHSTTDKINVYDFIHTLTELMNDNDIMVCGNGSACICTFQTSLIKKNQRIFYNSGNASMGFDLPATIGAYYQSAGRRTICLTGDGSVMMNLQELQTIKHHNLPLKIFIMNNGGYSSIRQTQRNFFDGRMTASGIDSGVSVPDFCKVANSFGIKSVKIESPSEMKEKIKQVLNYESHIVCEVMLEKEYAFLPKLSARKLDDGTMVSPSLENMYPFLDKTEYDENIYRHID